MSDLFGDHIVGFPHEKAHILVMSVENEHHVGYGSNNEMKRSGNPQYSQT